MKRINQYHQLVLPKSVLQTVTSTMGAFQDRLSHNNPVRELDSMGRILQGPKIDLDVPDIGIGEWFFRSLKSLPPDLTMLTESDTGKKFTADVLLKSSAGLAAGLSNLGISKGEHIAIIGDNTIAVCVSGIGSLFLGAVMCPIDPTLKSIEFQHILNIIQPKIIFADKAIIPEIEDACSKLELDVPIVIIDDEEENGSLTLESLILDISIEDFSPAAIEDPKNEVAIIVCSSGTTGMPKGVGLTHFALAFQTKACNSVWPSGTLMHTSYFYWISGILMMMGSATNGIPRVLVRTADPLMVLQTIETYKPLMGLMSPSLLAEVLQHPQIHDFDLSSLKAVAVGGAPMTQALVQKFNEIFQETKLKQAYGCSELSGLAIQTNPSIDVLSIGCVIPNVEIKVIDRESGDLLGPEEEGELLVRSPSLMKGYVGNEAATAEAVDDDGWYHTGDIVKYTNERVVYITGRAKELMKVAGHQISPEEIEAVLAGLDGVLDAVVVGIQVGENNLPMALVIKHADSHIMQEDICQAVADNLSEFKQLRAGVIFVDFIPKTSTGKIKRRVVQSLAEELYSQANSMGH